MARKAGPSKPNGQPRPATASQVWVAGVRREAHRFWPCRLGSAAWTCGVSTAASQATLRYAISSVAPLPLPLPSPSRLAPWFRSGCCSPAPSSQLPCLVLPPFALPIADTHTASPSDSRPSHPPILRHLSLSLSLLIHQAAIHPQPHHHHLWRQSNHLHCEVAISSFLVFTYLRPQFLLHTSQKAVLAGSYRTSKVRTSVSLPLHASVADSA